MLLLLLQLLLQLMVTALTLLLKLLLQQMLLRRGRSLEQQCPTLAPAASPLTTMREQCLEQQYSGLARSKLHCVPLLMLIIPCPCVLDSATYVVLLSCSMDQACLLYMKQQPVRLAVAHTQPSSSIQSACDKCCTSMLCCCTTLHTDRSLLTAVTTIATLQAAQRQRSSSSSSSGAARTAAQAG
jgi:hypothetical protein